MPTRIPPINGSQEDYQGPIEAPSMVPPEKIVPSGDGFKSLTSEETLTHRSAPKQTFAQCQPPSVLKGWADSIRMFTDWALGAGSPVRIFKHCSLQSQNMSNAWDVDRARQYFYNKNKGLPFDEWEAVTNFKGAFGPIELVTAGIDPTEQFVGSYRVDIFPRPNKTIEFWLQNTTSMQSFLYGRGQEYERSEMPFGGNLRQVFTWKEPAQVS